VIHGVKNENTANIIPDWHLESNTTRSQFLSAYLSLKKNCIPKQVKFRPRQGWTITVVLNPQISNLHLSFWFNCFFGLLVLARNVGGTNLEIAPLKKTQFEHVLKALKHSQHLTCQACKPSSAIWIIFAMKLRAPDSAGAGAKRAIGYRWQWL
jgi:hypothetical protein